MIYDNIDSISMDTFVASTILGRDEFDYNNCRLGLQDKNLLANQIKLFYINNNIQTSKNATI